MQGGGVTRGGTNFNIAVSPGTREAQGQGERHRDTHVMHPSERTQHFLNLLSYMKAVCGSPNNYHSNIKIH